MGRERELEKKRDEKRETHREFAKREKKYVLSIN